MPRPQHKRKITSLPWKQSNREIPETPSVAFRRASWRGVDTPEKTMFHVSDSLRRLSVEECTLDLSRESPLSENENRRQSTTSYSTSASTLTPFTPASLLKKPKKYSKEDNSFLLPEEPEKDSISPTNLNVWFEDKPNNKENLILNAESPNPVGDLDERSTSFDNIKKSNRAAYTPDRPVNNSLVQECPQTPRRCSLSFDDREPSHKLIRQNSLCTTKMLVQYHAGSKKKLGTKSKVDLRIIRSLGEGNFSEVFVAVDNSTSKNYALKKSKRQFKSKSDRARYLKEIEMYYAMTKNEYIVEYYNAWQEGGFFYLQLELCGRGSLSTVLTKAKSGIEADALWFCIFHVASGLSHMHKHGLVHFDIKPENIFISDSSICKIGDLGLTGEEGTITEGDEGDVRYMPLEILNCSVRCFSADIFSFGLSILELSKNRKLPLGGAEWHSLRHEKIPTSKQFGSLMRGMLKENPDKRVSSYEIRDAALKHTMSKPRNYFRHYLDSLGI